MPSDEIHRLRVDERISKDQAAAGPAFGTPFRAAVYDIGNRRINPGAGAGFLLFIASGVKREFRSLIWYRILARVGILFYPAGGKSRLCGKTDYFISMPVIC
jgi:hypothetical protein